MTSNLSRQGGTTAFCKTDLGRLIGQPMYQRALALLAALRFVALDDLLRCGVDHSEADRLVADGLVLRFHFQRRLTEEQPTAVLALSRQGSLQLAQAMDADPSTIPYSTRGTCKRSTMFLDHWLACSRFALLLARSLQQDASAKLLSWERDPERLADAVHLLQGPLRLGRQPLVADGLAVVRGEHRTEGLPEGLLVEIDRGTERPAYMARKYAGYLEWWRQGGPERRFNLTALRLLTIAPDARRRERLRAGCIEATQGHASGLFWFAAEDDILKDGLLAPVWYTTKAESMKLWS